MMKNFQEKLKQLKSKNRLRALSLPCGVDLSSNDYLGMREHPALRAAALTALEGGIEMGAGGSRLLRGHTEHHESLENFAANYFGAEKALYFATGFQANMALFQALPTRRDVIIFDELIHASARDGIQASHANHIKVRHNDLEDFESALKKARGTAEQIWIAVESLYSMDGDFAPLEDLLALANRYEAILIVDEAHASGVWGESGKGLAQGLFSNPSPAFANAPAPSPLGRGRGPRAAWEGEGLGMPDNLITLHTCGKAIGVAGGLVCASADIIDTLINVARSFIYSTAPPPLQALLVEESLKILGSADGQQRRDDLFKILNYVKSKKFLEGTFVEAGIKVESQIVPIMLGDEARALQIAESLQQDGFDIRAIRPPSVKDGTSRLRLSLSTHVTEEILDAFAAHLEALLAERKAA